MSLLAAGRGPDLMWDSETSIAEGLVHVSNMPPLGNATASKKNPPISLACRDQAGSVFKNVNAHEIAGQAFHD